MVKLTIKVTGFRDGIIDACLFIKNGSEDDTHCYMRMREELAKDFILSKCDHIIWYAKGEQPKWLERTLETFGNKH